MILLVCKSRKLRDSQASQYIAFFPSGETCENLETRTDIFVRSVSHFPQNSRKKNCEMRLAVNPTCGCSVHSALKTQTCCNNNLTEIHY
jgi:hypothetical protein